MPTYDYRCEKCGNEFEDFLPMSKRTKPTEEPCAQNIDVQQTKHMTFAQVCGGEVKQIIVRASGFAYDNIASPGHPKKPPGWMSDKLIEIKKSQPGSTMGWHH